MARSTPIRAKSPPKSSEYGYRSKAAKRLQTPKYKPDEEKSDMGEDEEEEGDGSWPVYEFPGQE